MIVNDRYGEIDIVPETVGMICDRIDMFAPIGIQLWFCVKLNKLKTECVCSELLGFRVGTITATTQ
jgi:hypothetical protein